MRAWAKADESRAAPESPFSERSTITFEQMAARVQNHSLCHVAGVRGSAGPALAHTLLAHTLLAHTPLRGERSVVYLCADAGRAEAVFDDLLGIGKLLRLFLGERAGVVAPSILRLPEPSAPAHADVHPDRRVQMRSAAVLFHLAKGFSYQFLVLTAPALLRLYAPPEALREAGYEFSRGQTLELESLPNRLLAVGYVRVPVVEDPASFAVRGGLVDLWPAGSDQPVRLELEGDELVKLRRFDPETQRTSASVERVWVGPARQLILTEGRTRRAEPVVRSLCDAVNWPSSRTRSLVENVTAGRLFLGAEAYLPAFDDLVPIWDYVGTRATWLIEDPARVVQSLESEYERAEFAAARQIDSPHFPVSCLYASPEQVGQALESRQVISAHGSPVLGAADGPLSRLSHTDLSVPSLETHDQADLSSSYSSRNAAPTRAADLKPLVDQIVAWQAASLRVAISARNHSQLDRLRALLSHRGLSVVDESEAGAGELRHVTLISSPLSRGLVAESHGFAIVAEEEIFGRRRHHSEKKNRPAGSALEDLRSVKPGDLVVHVEHGIGRYQGLEHKSIDGSIVDLLVVQYAETDRLFLPVYRLNQIQKYSGGDGQPKLDRLGGATFARTKNKVRRRVRDMADELLRLYAERASLKKVPLSEPDDDYAAFEATFPFEETADQAAAIVDVLSDLQKDTVMDRLVCGDVGFGKTEVALRAAYLCALSGRQVALLCPTTVLAQQHVLTFKQRLEPFGVVVEPLSRFRTRRQLERTLTGVRRGDVDVLVGTHRLLSKDVHFKNLGLLIIDEEQRFGVTHKERIKQLRVSVDVLTLSATPIPRTLQLALGGLRDLSLIATPPADRRAVRTLVSRFDDELIREALSRELERGGQVFYVYNRIEGIDGRAEHLRRLLPDVRLAVAHGQMSAVALEKTMLRFVAGEFDVLASTAIIENGLDIPRANTIIIDRADLFGLSQLYQLRGRVGRSSERGYCYLLVPRAGGLSEVARQRIEALERHTELGAGFRIATLDMELRGAGDLLGAEQSGNVQSVGFELFCQMLQEATRELQGLEVHHDVDPELSIDAEAFLPDDYIAEVGLRLSIYKRFASAFNEAEVDDVAAEMIDRFGPAPRAALSLVELMRLKTELRRFKALGCEATAKSATLHLREDTPIDPQKLSSQVSKPKSRWRLSPDGRLSRRAAEGEFKNGLEHARWFLQELSECLAGGPSAPSS